MSKRKNPHAVLGQPTTVDHDGAIAMIARILYERAPHGVALAAGHVPEACFAVSEMFTEGSTANGARLVYASMATVLGFVGDNLPAVLGERTQEHETGYLVRAVFDDLVASERA